MLHRREFVRHGVTAAAGLGLVGSGLGRIGVVSAKLPSLYSISLAQWSLHRTTFFKDKAEDSAFLNELRDRAESSGVTSLLIMIDGEGRLGDPNAQARTQAIENHYRWVEAARHLGCHSVRVNAASAGPRETQRDLVVDGLGRLTQFAADRELNVIVENHGGLSSDGAWLAEVMRQVGHPRCGTLPDFGNFDLGDGRSYDKYLGVEELMPFARAVSAKSYAFAEDGTETTIDFRRMMRIVVDSGYRGYVGIEYEGDELGEIEGIRATQSLLQRVRTDLQAPPGD
jgi:sugar phosphate isomerase/epimerase